MIRLTGISRTFHVGDEEVHALCNVDLTIEAGEYVSINEGGKMHTYRVVSVSHL